MRKFPRGLTVAMVLAMAGLVAGGAWFYSAQQAQLQRRVEAELSAIGRLKVEQIAKWRAERLGDAAILTESPFFTRGVERWLANPSDAAMGDILTRFRSMQRHYRYRDILLVDPAGRVRLSLAGFAGPLHPEALRVMRDALRDGGPRFADLHNGQDDVPHLGVVAPLTTARAGAARAVGAVVLQVDAREFLFPLVQSWPVPSETAETLLVRRDGDYVLFLNELRHRPDTALKLRIPLTRTDVPAVMAVLGRAGVVRGTDYRGVQVLSVLRAIPDSPWFMVAKVDEAEAFAGVRTRSALVLAILTVLAACLGIAGLVLWQRNEKAHYRALFQAEAAARQGEARYRVTLESIGDGVIVTDAAGRVELLNPVAETLTGWTGEEARGRMLGEVFRIVNEESRRDVESPVDRVLREGTVVGLANHTLLIARDGKERPIADSGAPIRGPAGRPAGIPDRVDGVVLVFRDQTEERAAEARLERSHRELRAILDILPVMVCVIDADRRVLMANRAFSEASGWPDIAPGGRACGALGCIHALDDPRGCGFGPRCETCALRLAVADTFATGATHHDIEYATTFQRGERRREVVLLAATARFPSAGAPQSLLCLVDITERKRAEQQTREQLDELQRWQAVTLGREERVRGLKRQINALHRRLGESARYAEEEDA